VADRPSGTVTFLFTDVEGSTRLLRALGPERYRAVLEDHRRIVRQAVAAHAGQEVDTQGDGFFIAFHRVQDAVAAATDIQRGLATHSWPDGLELRVRMGIHTTEALPADDGYVGVGVHTGARIGAAAHGGQVLLSQASAELAGEEHAIRLVDLGTHRLKDFSAPQRLHQLVIAGLPDRFPSPRSLAAGPSNLPPPMTPLIGRDREVREVVDLARRDGVRLVTLTGAGGAGKSRLALAAAAELIDAFEDGVFFVPLESISDAELVLPAIGQALSVSEVAGQSLSAFLAPKRMLLIIDNLEQVIGAASALARLLREAPGVRAIVTSREALRVAAEQIYPVAPLGPSEAIALFAERASAIQPGFAVTDANADAVGELCRRLEGLPLAVELAAARVSMLEPEAILARLDQRLTLLTGGSRDQPARLQTLRNTLRWSHDLLGAEERRLFADLSVFAGGFTLEAAEAIGDADLDLLRSLVDKSLVQRRVDRFLMLDTVREFAAEQLEASGELEAVKDRHAAFFEDLAARAHDVRLHRQAVADELEADHDNLRAALDWLSVADAARYARLAGRLGWFWHVHSHFAEGRARVEDALARTPPDGDEDHARLLSAAVELAAWHGDAVAAERLGADALSAWRALGRDDEAALVLHDLGWGHFFAGGDLALGRRRMEESLELHRSLGDPQLINRGQLGLLQLLVAVGDVATVKQLAPEALDVAQRLGDRWSEHFAHHFLADCALIEGDTDEAQRRYRLSLEAAWESGDQVETCYELQGMAMAAAAAGNPERALRLAAAAKAAMDALGVQVLPQFWSDLIDRHVATAREALSELDAESAWRAGLRLPLDAAVDEAMARPAD
jgi:predicted ATPase/class 3 adenylate cyclase